MSSPSPPAAAALLEQERHCRRHGSGLTAAELIGPWRLDQVWGRRDAQPQPAASALLRGLRASLAIAAGAEGALRLRNSVELGALHLRFEGPGELRGRRPLLAFWFEGWQLLLAGRVLLQGRLAAPEPRRWPFFALIACGSGQWLAARGRGGGLALWRRAN